MYYAEYTGRIWSFGMQYPLSASSRMLAPASSSPLLKELLRHRRGRPAPRSAGEALSEGIRLTLAHLRHVLVISVIGWAPGELVRLLTLLLPLSPAERVLGSLASLGLTLLGVAFVSVAVVALL